MLVSRLGSKVPGWGDLQCHSVYTEFHNNWSISGYNAYVHD